MYVQRGSCDQGVEQADERDERGGAQCDPHERPVLGMWRDRSRERGEEPDNDKGDESTLDFPLERLVRRHSCLHRLILDPT